MWNHGHTFRKLCFLSGNLKSFTSTSVIQVYTDINTTIQARRGKTQDLEAWSSTINNLDFVGFK